MGVLRVAAAAAHFGHDVAFDLDRVRAIVARARDGGAGLIVLPASALGGYLRDLRTPPSPPLPPTLHAGDPAFDTVRGFAGDAVVCLGYTEDDGAGGCYESAVCLTGDGVLGRQRKVHQNPAEATVFAAGDSFTAFDTPVGRLGMLLDYDKTFPEAARTLALDGAAVLACLSAWPASVTRRAAALVHDRQTRLFDLYDRARAAENQVVLVSANQTGTSGELRFLGRAKVVGPGGDVLAHTSVGAGLAVAEVDVDGEIGRARRVLHHLGELRPDAYTATEPVTSAP